MHNKIADGLLLSGFFILCSVALACIGYVLYAVWTDDLTIFVKILLTGLLSGSLLFFSGLFIDEAH